MDYKKLFNYAMLTGEIMLRSGAETSRVEDTINRILRTSQFSTVESFVTPTGIFATLDDPSIDMISFVKRVHKREVHLHRVAQANDLSRRFCSGEIELDEALEVIQVIKKERPYPKRVLIMAKGIGAAAFTIVFGGNFGDMFVTLIIGIVFAMVQVLLRRIETSKFLEDIVCGAIIAILAIISCYYLKVGKHFDIIVIGSIMPLVPGVAITNAIREIIQGDFISGISRAADAFIVAASIAIGVGSVLKLFFMVGGAIG